MSAPTQKEIRAWAKSAGIEVNPRGSIRSDVAAAFKRAHSTDPELAARVERPDIFAAADDAAEAEMFKRGLIQFSAPATPAASRTFAEWLSLRDGLVTVLVVAMSEDKAQPIAEQLLLDGWAREAAA